MLAAGFVAPLGLAQIDMILMERTHRAVQTGPETVVPFGEARPPEKTYGYLASIIVSEGMVEMASLTGPPFPYPGETLVFEEGMDEYVYEEQFDTSAAMEARIEPGTYSILGDSTTSGSFMEDVALGSYNELPTLRVTNFNELQSFDPEQPVTIHWQPFTEGQSTDIGLNLGYDGLIIVEITYHYNGQQTEVYLSEDYLGEEALGVSPMETSVEIPTGILSGNPEGIYDLILTFILVESAREGWSMNVGMVAAVTAYEVEMQLHVAGGTADPWGPYTVSPDGWTDTGDWLGLVNIANKPWVWSPSLDSYLFIPDEGIGSTGGWVFNPVP